MTGQSSGFLTIQDASLLFARPRPSGSTPSRSSNSKNQAAPVITSKAVRATEKNVKRQSPSEEEERLPRRLDSSLSIDTIAAILRPERTDWGAKPVRKEHVKKPKSKERIEKSKHKVPNRRGDAAERAFKVASRMEAPRKRRRQTGHRDQLE